MSTTTEAFAAASTLYNEGLYATVGIADIAPVVETAHAARRS